MEVFFLRLSHWVNITWSTKKSTATRACHDWMQSFHKVKATQCISARKCYARIPKGKYAWETTKKAKNGEWRIVLKRLVKQRKHYLSLARRVSKTRRILRLQYRSTIFFKFRFFGESNDPNEILNIKKKSLKNIKYWQRNGGFKFWPEVKITRLIDIFLESIFSLEADTVKS